MYALDTDVLIDLVLEQHINNAAFVFQLMKFLYRSDVVLTTNLGEGKASQLITIFQPVNAISAHDSINITFESLKKIFASQRIHNEVSIIEECEVDFSKSHKLIQHKLLVEISDALIVQMNKTKFAKIYSKLSEELKQAIAQSFVADFILNNEFYQCLGFMESRFNFAGISFGVDSEANEFVKTIYAACIKALKPYMRPEQYKLLACGVLFDQLASHNIANQAAFLNQLAIQGAQKQDKPIVITHTNDLVKTVAASDLKVTALKENFETQDAYVFCMLSGLYMGYLKQSDVDLKDLSKRLVSSLKSQRLSTAQDQSIWFKLLGCKYNRYESGICRAVCPNLTESLSELQSLVFKELYSEPDQSLAWLEQTQQLHDKTLVKWLLTQYAKAVHLYWSKSESECTRFSLKLLKLFILLSAPFELHPAIRGTKYRDGKFVKKLPYNCLQIVKQIDAYLEDPESHDHRQLVESLQKLVRTRKPADSFWRFRSAKTEDFYKLLDGFISALLQHYDLKLSTEAKQWLDTVFNQFGIV